MEVSKGLLIIRLASLRLFVLEDNDRGSSWTRISSEKSTDVHATTVSDGSVEKSWELYMNVKQRRRTRGQRVSINSERDESSDEPWSKEPAYKHETTILLRTDIRYKLRWAITAFGILRASSILLPYFLDLPFTLTSLNLRVCFDLVQRVLLSLVKRTRS